MRYLEWTLVLICYLIVFIHPGLAQETDETVSTTQLDQMIVSAEREDTMNKDVITVETIQAPSISGSALDAMGNEAGVQLQRCSLSGSDGGKLRLRGFDETRLRISKDGVPLNRDGSYGNGPVDWSNLSSENVEQIEIYRGAGPAKFGNTLGGVINIVTHKPTEDPETVIRASYGSLNTWDGNIRHQWKIDKVGWVLSAGHFQSDGYLRNNTMDRNNFSALVTLDLPAGWQIGGGMDYSDKENGNPVYNRPDSPYYNSKDPDADEKELGGPGIGSRLIAGRIAWGDDTTTEDKNINLGAFLGKKGAKGNFRVDFRHWNQERTETYFDAANSNRQIYQRETQAEDNNWSLQAVAQRGIENHNIELGGETKRYGWGAQDVTFIDTGYFNGSIRFFEFIREGFKGQPDIMSYNALYAQDTWVLKQDLKFEFGLRQEWFKADSVDSDAFGFVWPAAETDLSEDHLDPRLAVIYHPWEAAAISARFGITHRYPTSPEYFWWYLNNASGYFNTDFNSEEACQYELAYVQSVRDIVGITIRGYYYDIEDYISSTQIPGVGSVYYNIGQVEIKGFEAGLSANLPHGLRAWANATWQKGDKADDPWDTDNRLSRQLPDLPEVMVNAGIDYRVERWLVRLWMNHVDERKHYDGDTLATLAAYTLVNAAVTYRIWDNQSAKLYLEVTGINILDEDYEEEAGNPMPGASVIGGVRMKF